MCYVTSTELYTIKKGLKIVREKGWNNKKFEYDCLNAVSFFKYFNKYCTYYDGLLFCIWSLIPRVDFRQFKFRNRSVNCVAYCFVSYDLWSKISIDWDGIFSLHANHMIYANWPIPL